MSSSDKRGHKMYTSSCSYWAGRVAAHIKDQSIDLSPSELAYLFYFNRIIRIQGTSCVDYDVFGTSTKGKQRHVSEVLSSSKADVDATESLLLFGSG